MLVLGSVLLACHGNRIEQFIGGSISQFGIMFKDDQFPHRHLPAAGRMVVLKHIDDRLPKQGEILFRKAGHLSG